ncbi:hypothetical protein ACFYO2_27425 [Streptomyces sp. NPDC006602]|uniref:hypothetical protein n=1 Tax=Streptomyces sp. NPDC006602 TaxID=3364751 RepID=UPI0036A2291F
MAEQKSTQNLPQPLRAAASVLSKVPGAGTVGRAAEGTLDRIGAVSPRGRRIAVYTGAGVLGVAGIVEWPVAITGAAVAWLTQPRRQETQEQAEAADVAGDTHPTPQVLASSAGRPSAGAEGTASPATPSDRLPTHHKAPPAGGGPGGSTTARRTRTNS